MTMNAMIKRRPERKRSKNEAQITFFDIKAQNKAQVILKSQHINFRVSGLGLYVFNTQEYFVLGILSKAGIAHVEPIVEQVPVCEVCNKEVNTEWLGPGRYWAWMCPLSP